MTTSNVIDIKGAELAPRGQRSRSETLILTPEMVGKWLKPPCQRPLKVNPKVLKLSGEIKTDEVIPGIITLGRLKSSTALYIVDGQHRIEAFKLAQIAEAIADIRILTFDTMADLAEEFVELNSALVKMQPDDILRGLESSSKALKKIRAECGYVGYDNVRRNANAPIVGMSSLLRCWAASVPETPVGHPGKTSAQVAMEMDDESISTLLRFMHLAFSAWGREMDYRRLWTGLNMTMAMWLYRRLVLDKTRGVRRYVILNDQQFGQCLMSLSADAQYLDWLQGRMMSERDRSPCYSHLRRIFAKRLIAEGNEKTLLPSPPWSTNSGARSR